MSVVGVTGVSGYLGRHLLARLEAAPDVTRVVGIDVHEPVGSPKLEFHQLDVRDARLAKTFVGVDVVVHLAFRLDPIRDEERMRSINVDGTRNVLEAAAATGVRKLVYPSSATVYGAHSDNDVPLGEEAPLRANADFAYARHKLDTERLVEAFRGAHPDVVVTVFRGANVLGPSVDNFVSRLLEAPRVLTVVGYEPPLQVIHEEDFSDALAFAVSNDLDGVFNLAADGWLEPSEVLSLTGKKTTPVPEEVAFTVAERLWRSGLSMAPAGELHYVMHPWVVDNAKLRAAGWEPRHSNRDTLLETVESHRDWIVLGRARFRRATIARAAVVVAGVIASFALARRARR
ncbi:MAG: SDR family oxidoreductase [Actinomycetota bacterium]